MILVFKKANENIISCDVVVVGGGLAGCIAAVKAKEYGANVVLVDKGYVSRSGSSVFAAGVINICTPEDEKDLWLQEIIEKGDYLNDQEWVNILLNEVYPLVLELERLGYRFGKKFLHRDEHGNLKRIKGRGNKYTFTSLISPIPVMDILRKRLQELRIPIYDRVMVTDLIKEGNRAAGVVGLDYINKEFKVFRAKAVIIAASGCGFKSFFIGHKNLTGEGQVMAYEAGAEMRNLEQACSNTTAKLVDVHGLSMMVGMGARFRNALGEEFMWRYDPELGNRAINDIITTAFCKEVVAGRGPIYMDLTGLDSEGERLIRQIVPEGIQALESVGIRPFKEMIEWIPAFYGTIAQGGGININTKCETSVPGLYAIGDSACAPQHGTYSVTGLNLAFCFPSGERAARFSVEYAQNLPDISEKAEEMEEQIGFYRERILMPLKRGEGPKPEEVIYEIQKIMLPYDVCYLRTKKSLEGALNKLLELREEKLNKIKATNMQELVKARESYSMAVVAEMILRSCLWREESRGHLYREDFPLTDNDNWLKWVVISRKGEKMKLRTDDVPTPYVIPPKGKYPRIPGIN